MREYKLVLTVPQCKALNRRKTHNEMALRKKKAKLRLIVYMKIKVNRVQRCVLSSHTGINTIFPTYINNIQCALISHIKGHRFSFWWDPYCPSICIVLLFFLYPSYLLSWLHLQSFGGTYVVHHSRFCVVLWVIYLSFFFRFHFYFLSLLFVCLLFCVFVLCLECPMLPVSLDWSSCIVRSVFSNV